MKPVEPETVYTKKERVLCVEDVCELTRVSPNTARKLMKETGHCLRVHSRLYVFESNLFDYLHSMEVA